MQKKYNFLVLTDHRVHQPKNPVYHLLPTLSKHEACEKLHIGSLGSPGNHNFFQLQETTSLEVLPIDQSFTFDDSEDQFLHNLHHGKLKDYDVILMRLARPIPDGFFAFLKREASHAIFINDPLGIEKTSSKEFLLNFPDKCPPMRFCHSTEEILDFSSQFPIVLKPLEEYGGKGLLKIEGDSISTGSQSYHSKDYLKEIEPYIHQKGYLAMKFLKNVGQGDKRILVVGGQVMGASLRMPPEGSWLCNVAQGGTSVPAQLTPEEEQIVQRIAPVLEEEGILIYGVDTLVDDDGQRVLSEINTLSVGGFYHIQKQTKKPIIEHTIQKIIDYVDQKL